MSQHTPSREPGRQQSSASSTTTTTEHADLETSQLVLRAFLLGGFTLERANGESIDVSTSIGRSQSILLLKLLLCHPQRRVSRELLTEIIWPGQSYSIMDGSLSVAKSLLKTGLEVLCGQSLLPRANGDPPNYRLAGQSVLWTDVDACEYAIRRAIATQNATEALVQWETAYLLLQRGVLLADDQVAYWYQARLVQDRRKKLAKQRSQCVLRIADLALECGDSNRAIDVLTNEHEANPIHEDIAFHLMELLAQLGRNAEALHSYARLEAALLERDAKPRTEIQALAHHLRSEGITRASVHRHLLFQQAEMGESVTESVDNPRTQDITDDLRTRQIQHKGVTIPDSTTTNTLQTTRAVPPEYRTPASLSDTGESVHVVSGEPLYYANDTMNRREAGKKIVTLGASLLTAPQLFDLMDIGTLLHDEEILSVCAASIPIFWRLYFDGQLSEVQRVLPGYISQLALLVRQPSGYQQQAASLASKAHQLACMLALQEQDYGLAFIHVDQALQGASRADDANLRVASLIRKALVYRYINRYRKKCPDQIVETYQEAAQYRSFVSPLLRGRLYTGLAEAYSECAQEYEAKHALELAYTIFPENPQDDPNFSYTHFKLPQGFEVVMYLNLKQAHKAWEVLAKIDTSVPMTVVPDRVELTIDQARTSLLLGDMEQSCKYVEFAATSACALGSHLRYKETYRIYERMHIKWLREQQVQALARYFPE